MQLTDCNRLQLIATGQNLRKSQFHLRPPETAATASKAWITWPPQGEAHLKGASVAQPFEYTVIFVGCP